MILVFRAVKLFSILAFIGVLAFTYYDMAERSGTGQITLFFNTNLSIAESVDNTTYFLVPAIFLIVLNLLVSISKALYRRIPLKFLSIPNRSYWLENDERRHQLNTIFEVWFDTFATAVHIFIITLMLQIWQINRDLTGGSDKYILYLFAGIAILTIWSLFIAGRFFFKK